MKISNSTLKLMSAAGALALLAAGGIGVSESRASNPFCMEEARAVAEPPAPPKKPICKIPVFVPQPPPNIWIGDNCPGCGLG